MKKNRLLVVLTLSMLSLIGCKDELLTFFISHEVGTRIESNSALDLPFELATPDVTTESNQKFASNNTAASLVKDVKLTELKLSITSPSGKTFSFLKSVKIFISTSQSDEILLASAETIPTTATSVTLTPTQEKLDKYVKASSYKLRTQVVTRETLTQAVDLKLNLKFKVTADPL